VRYLSGGSASDVLLEPPDPSRKLALGQIPVFWDPAFWDTDPDSVGIQFSSRRV